MTLQIDAPFACSCFNDDNYFMRWNLPKSFQCPIVLHVHVYLNRSCFFCPMILVEAWDLRLIEVPIIYGWRFLLFLHVYYLARCSTWSLRNVRWPLLWSASILRALCSCSCSISWLSPTALLWWLVARLPQPWPFSVSWTYTSRRGKFCKCGACEELVRL